METDDIRGKITNPKRRKQIIDASDLLLRDGITPTDTDLWIEYKGKAYIWIELKLKDADMPYGQELAFVRQCDDMWRFGKHALVIVASHQVEDPEQDIKAGKTRVRKYRSCGHWHFPDKEIGKDITTRELIDAFIKRVEG